MPYADPEARREHNRLYYSKNKNAIKVQATEYRKNNKEKVRLGQQKYYQANKEKIQAHQKEYYSKPENQEKRRVAYRVWAEKNRDSIREKQQKYYADPENRKRLQERQKEYHKKYYANPENRKRAKEYHKEWYLKNKDKKNAQASANYKANKEAYDERTRRNRAAKPELYRQLHSAGTARYNARKKNVETDGHSIAELHEYWKERGVDPKRCSYCNAWHTKWKNDWKTSVGDHVVPMSKGGADTMDNLRPCCFSCNTSKGNRLLHVQWIPPNMRELETSAR